MGSSRKLALLALGVAAIAVAIVLAGGGDSGYTIKAELANAGGLRKNSSVKIAGVPAGKVEALEITDEDTAVATLKLDEGAAPIGKDAKLKVRPSDLLGERYAEIQPGDVNDPMPSGDMIVEQRTSTPVELDDVLNMLDVDTRTRLGLVINEVGVAFTGRGTDFNKLLAQLPGSLEETDKLLEQVGAENAAIREGAQRADRVTALVNDRREDMGDLIAQGSDALEVVNRKRASVGNTIRNAPGALSRLRGTLGTLDRASLELRPTAQAIKATAAPLQETLKALPEFADAAGPALEKAQEVSPTLTKLSREATPTIRRLQPTARKASTALTDSAPLLRQLDRRSWDDLLFAVNNLNLGLRGRDGISHFIGAKLNIASEYIDNAIENFALPAEDRPAARKKPAPVKAPKVDVPKVKDDVKETVKKPFDEVKETVDQLKDTVKGVTEGVRGAVDETTKKADEAVKGIVGSLEQKQQQQGSGGEGSDALRLFDYLMGQ